MLSSGIAAGMEYARNAVRRLSGQRYLPFRGIEGNAEINQVGYTLGASSTRMRTASGSHSPAPAAMVSR